MSAFSPEVKPWFGLQVAQVQPGHQDAGHDQRQGHQHGVCQHAGHSSHQQEDARKVLHQVQDFNFQTGGVP